MDSNIATSCSSQSDSTSVENLHQAIIDRDLKTIVEVFSKKDSWKPTDNNGETVLHLAFQNKEEIVDAQQKIISILESFVNEGWSLNVKNISGKTILFLAIENRLRDVIDFLLKNGADINVRDECGNSIVHFLIEDQFKQYSELCVRETPLEEREVFEHEDIDFMNWLLIKGIDNDCKNNHGKTALQLSIERNLQHVMPILIRYTNDVKYVDEFGRTIVEVFFQTKSSMNIRYAPGPTYIYNKYYGYRYEIDIVKFLLNKGVSVDSVDKKGNTLVHTFTRSFSRNPEIIRWMLQRYTSINARDEYGDTALHLVIDNSISLLGQHKKNTIDFVLILLTKGADVHLRKRCGDSPVRQAVYVKHAEILKMLMKYGADLSPNTNGIDLLHSVSRPLIVSSHMDDRGYASVVDILVSAGYDVNAIVDGYTPLMEACRFNCPQIAQRLIDNGANVHYREVNEHMSAIHVASLSCMHSDDNSLLQILLKAGASVNDRTVYNETALHLAASSQSYSTTKTLLNLEADIDARNYDGHSPLYKAVFYKNIGGVKALLEFGADVNDEQVMNEIVRIADNTENDDTTVDYLLQHCAKVKVANLAISDRFPDCSNKNMDQYYNECREEVTTLKAYWLDDQTTLYNLLHMDIHCKFNFIANNDRLKKLINSRSFENSFPKYHILIMACYNKAVARKPLVQPAKFAWYQLTGINLPDICVTQILVHMNNEELKMMTGCKDNINSLKRWKQISIDEGGKKSRIT